MQGKVYRWFYWVMLLGTVMAYSGCTSTKSIPKGTVMNHTNIQYYLNKGDKVEVTTIDDSVYHFEIVSIEDTEISGRGIKVPYSSIAEIETDFGNMSANPMDKKLDAYSMPKEIEPIQIYKAWVNKTDNTKLYGLLYHVQDTTLRISEWDNEEPYDLNKFNYIDVNAHEIGIIKVRKKGKQRRTAIAGASFGFVIGLVVGLQDEGGLIGPLASGIGGGIALGAVGYGVGTGIGAIRINIPINGSAEQFKANQARLKEYSYRKQP